jgi:hypothetical protein
MQPAERRNAAVNVVGEALWGTTSAMISSATVLVVALRELGAGPAMIGSISTLETVSGILPQLLGMYLFRSRSAMKKRLIAYHYAFVIPAILLMGLLLLAEPVLGRIVTRCAVFAAYGLFIGSIGVIGAVWMDWLARIFRVAVRGTVMGMAFCSSAAAGTLGALGAGAWLNGAHGIRPFALLYIAAAVVACASLATFWLVDDPGATDDDAPKPSAGAIIADFKHSLSDTNFRSFLTGRILTAAGFCMVPLIADYFSSPDGGAIPAGTLVTAGAALTVGAAIANMGFGRLGDLYGHRLGLIIGAVFQVIALTILLAGAGQAACVAAYLCAGVCAGAGVISHFNMVFETCPHDNRTAHIIVANLVVGSMTFLLPMLAGLAAAHFGTRTVFAGCLVMSVVAVGWIVLKVKDPRRGVVE